MSRNWVNLDTKLKSYQIYLSCSNKTYLKLSVCLLMYLFSLNGLLHTSTESKLQKVVSSSLIIGCKKTILKEEFFLFSAVSIIWIVDQHQHRRFFYDVAKLWHRLLHCAWGYTMSKYVIGLFIWYYNLEVVGFSITYTWTYNVICYIQACIVRVASWSISLSSIQWVLRCHMLLSRYHWPCHDGNMHIPMLSYQVLTSMYLDISYITLYVHVLCCVRYWLLNYFFHFGFNFRLK